MKRVSRELLVWSRLHHPNIIQLLGYALETKDTGYPMLISEWMVNGSLAKYMIKVQDLDVLHFVRFLITDIACRSLTSL